MTVKVSACGSAWTAASTAIRGRVTCKDARRSMPSSSEVAGTAASLPQSLEEFQFLLQQPREPPVLEDPPLGLAVRAVGHHVVLVEHRLQHGVAARARLPLVRVHAGGLREL